MNRASKYDQWQTLKFDGKSFMGPKEAKKYNLISDYNFEYFANCIDWMIRPEEIEKSEGKNYIQSVKTQRSSMVLFLTDDIIRSYNIDALTKELIVDYINRKYPQDATRNNKINAIKKLIAFSFPNVADEINFDELIIRPGDIQYSEEGQATPLTVNQIALCRAQYAIKTDDHDSLRKRYIFEMMLHTSLNADEISRFQKKNLSITEENNSPVYTIKKNKVNNGRVPEIVGNLIISMDSHGLLGFDKQTYMEQMKEELKHLGIINFKRGDLNKTREVRFLVCPQCSNTYEALASNWCLRKYHGEDDYRIVCRENCSK